MPRRKIERKVGGHCKIRKRACSSSTSSSSLVKNYRLKRAILVGKRAGSSTPVPTWKMASRSPSLAKQSHGGDKGKEAQMSARRLAATLWGINGLQSPGGGEKESFEGEKVERDRKSVEKIAKLFGAELGLTHLLDQSQSPVCKNKDGSKPARHQRKSSGISQKLQLSDYIGGEELDSVTNGDLIEVASHSAAETTATIKSRLKDVSSSLAASKEIIKVLFRLWSQEEQNMSRMTLVSALRVEIDRARHQVDQLIQEQRYNQKDIESLLKQFAAEKAAWKNREQQRIFDATALVVRELENEKKLRRQSERLNKRLGRELADKRSHLSKAVKELECEKRAREILEQTCDELAKGLGEDRAEVEELKRESATVREEVEKERQMLQLADVLREERVQMKLAEARYEYEEKNAALERLRSELEVYLGGQQSNGNGGGNHDSGDFADYLENIQFGSCQNGERKQHSEGEVEEDEHEGSGDSELHSIELNMDSLSKSYKWSFTNEGQADSRRTSVDEVFKGRRSLSEKIQWENICLMKKTSDGLEWDFTNNNNRKQGNGNGFDKARLSEVSSQGERNDQKPIQVCKDFSGSRGVQSCTSSRAESPLGKVSQGNSKRFSVSLGDHFDGNFSKGSKR